MFEFQVQLRTSEETMPVEDATVEWPERESSYRTVAHLLLPRQEIELLRMQDAHRNLAFNVWHCLAVHRPLGVVIISLFTAFVASRLTAEQIQVNIKNVADLADARAGTVKDSTSEGFLKRSGIARRSYENADLALQALANSEIDAVLYDRPALRFLIVQNYAKLTVLSTIVDRESYAFAFPENSKLLEPVNQKLLERINSPSWKNVEYRYLGR